jgi:putative metallohydrolase (TIGR04338 family)
MRCQQDQLYAAEAAAPFGRTFATEEELQSWVDGLRDNRYWQVLYPQVRRVDCFKRARAGKESVGWFERDRACGVIEMSPTHMNQRVVLHELAHVLAAARYGSTSHDPFFARVYLELVAVFYPEGYLPLYESFAARGIEFDIEDERLGQARAMPAAVGPSGS